MVRQNQKQSVQQQKIVDDIKFLLSNIRARQNGLIFFLEMFTSAAKAIGKPELYQIYKHQFLQKQKIYTNQTMHLIQKLSAQKISNNQIKAFWIKLKSILRVTLERARTLGLLTLNLANKYEEIIMLVNEAHQNSHQMKQFNKIEQLIKKRTIQALIATKNHLTQNSMGMQNKDQSKNRSETFLKLANKPIHSINFSPTHNKIQNEEPFRGGESVEAKALNKLKSLTRVRRKQQKIKAKNCMNDLKRTQSALLKYQLALSSVMDCRYDYKFDKQKSKAQNQSQLYDLMFDRNIANHKIITKFIHRSYKFSCYMNKVKNSNNNKQRNVQSQKKYNRGARQFRQLKEIKEIIKNQTQEDGAKRDKQKGKLLRPKTSKQRKIVVRKISGTKEDASNQLIYL